MVLRAAACRAVAAVPISPFALARRSTSYHVRTPAPLYPKMFKGDSLYDGKHLDMANPFRAVVVHDVLYEKRYEEYLKDKEAGKFPDLDKPPLQYGNYNRETSLRVGLIAIKVKTMHMYDEFGNRLLLTMLWAPNSSVIAHHWAPSVPNIRRKGPKWGMTVAAGFPNDDDPISRDEARMYDRVSKKVKDYAFRHVTWKFPVTEDAMLPIGFRLNVRHFFPGQGLKITSKSKGKGFQGVVKRYRFKGGPASHGSSLFHRGTGSTGSSGDGHKLPGKRLPGHMGHRRVTFACKLHMVDFKNDLLYVQTSIPGEIGQYVIVRDNPRRNRFATSHPPAFPSHRPRRAENLEAKSFEECQRRMAASRKYHTDFGILTKSPNEPGARA